MNIYTTLNYNNIYVCCHLQIQFVLVMLHAFQLLIWNECNYPIAFAYFIGAHAIMFYFLFSNFYKRAYTKVNENRNYRLIKNDKEIALHPLISSSKQNFF